MDRFLPVESLPQIDFENTRNKDADETVRGVIQTIQNAILLIYLTLQISMKTNRVALHTTKTKVTMEVTNMQKVIAKTKI